MPLNWCTDQAYLRPATDTGSICGAVEARPSLHGTSLSSRVQYAGNIAEGKYDFQSSLNRLHALRAKLDEETESWRQKGKELTARRSYISSTLKDEHAKLNTEGIEVCPATWDFALSWMPHNLCHPTIAPRSIAMH